MEQELIEKLNRCIDFLVEAPNKDRLRQVTLEIIKIEENLACARVLWGKNGDMKFQEHMFQIFKEQYIQLLPKNSRSEYENEFIYTYNIQCRHIDQYISQ